MCSECAFTSVNKLQTLRLFTLSFIFCIISCTVAVAVGHTATANCGGIAIDFSFDSGPAAATLKSLSAIPLAIRLAVTLAAVIELHQLMHPKHCSNSCDGTTKFFCGVPFCVCGYQSRACFGIHELRTFSCHQ